jgi:hypothetical protein
MVDHRRHFPASSDLTRPALGSEDGHLGRGQIFQDYFRHELERAPGVMFDGEHTAIGPDLVDLISQGRCDWVRRFVGDDGDALMRLQTQTSMDGVTRSGNELGIDGNLIKGDFHDLASGVIVDNEEPGFTATGTDINNRRI